jgi:SAM-dependent methyltransferase
VDLATFRALLTPEGERLLTTAPSLDLSDAGRLRSLEQLRRLASPALGAAAYETARLRLRARAKFSNPAAMYFTSDALEQASGELPARHRARRLAAFDRVVDLGCGIGGDALALAEVTRVVGVDRDPLRLAMARENARALGVAEAADWVRAEIGEGGPALAAAACVDPSRREGRRRIFSPAAYDPPLDSVLSWRNRFAVLAVKVAPGIRDEFVARLDGEVEFVAVGEDLKEAVLWLGVDERGRRATLLPAGVSLHGEPDQVARVASPGRFLIEPNPAVIRAHLLGQLAQMLDAWQIDPTIAYLSSDRPTETPFARSWVVEDVLPFGVARVRSFLRARLVGRLTVKKRGSPLNPEQFIRLVRPAGPASRTVFLTRVLGRPAAVICLDPGAEADAHPGARSDQPSARIGGGGYQ